MKAIGAALTSLFLSGCATIAPERGHKEVGGFVQERIGQRTSWEQGTPEDAKVASRIGELLKLGLTRAKAVEIALMNSPSLQATYEELGVSQADMVQAGLLSNPTLSGSFGWSGAGGPVEYEASLVQSFLDIFVLPLRKRVAEQQFTVDTLRVAHEALRTAAQVSKLFADVQAQVQLVDLRRIVIHAAQSAADLAERQHRAGNITDLALAQEQARYQQARLELANDELELSKFREELNRILGLWGPQTDWSLAEKLPELPEQEVSLEHLETMAIRQRLDVDAARKEALLMQNAVDLARTSRLFGMVQVGVHVHQDPDGPRLFGPTLDLELPIFDQRQALIGKLEAQKRQAERRLASLSVNARSEVRVARLTLLTTRNQVDHYRKVLLPLRERVLNESQLQYNGMQIGLFELLAAKQEQVEAYRAYVESLRDYWKARAELEQQLGGRIVTLPAKAENSAANDGHNKTGATDGHAH